MKFIILNLVLAVSLALGVEKLAHLLHYGSLLGDSTNNYSMYMCQTTDNFIQWQVDRVNTAITYGIPEEHVETVQGLGYNFTPMFVSSMTVDGRALMVAIAILSSQSTANRVTCSSNSNRSVAVSTEHASITSSVSGSVTLQSSFSVSISGHIQISVFWCGGTDELIGWLFNDGVSRGFGVGTKIGDIIPLKISSSQSAVMMLYGNYPYPQVSLLLVVGPLNSSIKCTTSNHQDYVEFTAQEQPTPTNATTPYHTPPEPRPTYNNSEGLDVASSEFLPMKICAIDFSYNVVANETTLSSSGIAGGLVAVIALVLVLASIVVAVVYRKSQRLVQRTILTFCMLLHAFV